MVLGIKTINFILNKIIYDFAQMVCDWQITEKRINYFCKYEFHCVLNIIKNYV